MTDILLRIQCHSVVLILDLRFPMRLHYSQRMLLIGLERIGSRILRAIASMPVILVVL